MVFYVNCLGETGLKQKEFDSLEKSLSYYENCKLDKEWNHIEITNQIKVYLRDSDEEWTQLTGRIE